jgi:hypothetical protein
MGHPKEPQTAQDYMPSERAKKAAAEARRAKHRDKQEIADELRSVMDNWLKPADPHAFTRKPE